MRFCFFGDIQHGFKFCAMYCCGASAMSKASTLDALFLSASTSVTVDVMHVLMHLNNSHASVHPHRAHPQAPP